MYSSSQCFLMCKNLMMGFNAVTLPVSSCSKAWTILTEGHNICPGLIHLVVSLMQLLKTGVDEPRQVQMTICKGFPGCHEGTQSQVVCLRGQECSSCLSVAGSYMVP